VSLDVGIDVDTALDADDGGGSGHNMEVVLSMTWATIILLMKM
jgi:hypothetical protein